jgi:hypothetical protein
MSDGQSSAAAAATYSNSPYATNRLQGPAQPTSGTGAGYVAGAQLAGYGAQAFATYKAGQYNARIKRINAYLGDVQAANAIAGGEREVNALRARGRAIFAGQRAAFAGGNVVVDQDTSADILRQSEAALANDVETTRLNATLQAFGYQLGAVSNRAQARLDVAEANNRAAATLLGGSATAFKTYDRLNDGA